MVGGKNAKSYYSTASGTGDIYHTVEIVDTPTTGLRALIQASEQDKSNSVAKNDIFNQILSTFRFVEATPAANPTISPLSSPTSVPVTY